VVLESNEYTEPVKNSLREREVVALCLRYWREKKYERMIEGWEQRGGKKTKGWINGRREHCCVHNELGNIKG
jgi:hypothetical protein